jgi:hypothetical protein
VPGKRSGAGRANVSGPSGTSGASASGAGGMTGASGAGGMTGASEAGGESAALDPVAHKITLLSRPGCHLCDDARAVVARVAADLGLTWEERDITGSATDMGQYGDMIPVTLIDGVQHDFWRVSEERLRAALGRPRR